MPLSDEEIEALRLERLEALAEDCDMSADELSETSQRGSISFHEALHTAFLAMDFNDRHLMDHPAILADPALYRLAQKVHEHLSVLYEQIGKMALEGDKEWH